MLIVFPAQFEYFIFIFKQGCFKMPITKLFVTLMCSGSSVSKNLPILSTVTLKQLRCLILRTKLKNNKSTGQGQIQDIPRRESSCFLLSICGGAWAQELGMLTMQLAILSICIGRKRPRLQLDNQDVRKLKLKQKTAKRTNATAIKIENLLNITYMKCAFI